MDEPLQDKFPGGSGDDLCVMGGVNRSRQARRGARKKRNHYRQKSFAYRHDVLSFPTKFHDRLTNHSGDRPCALRNNQDPHKHHTPEDNTRPLRNRKNRNPNRFFTNTPQKENELSNGGAPKR